jgi:hypothetical protein
MQIEKTNLGTCKGRGETSKRDLRKVNKAGVGVWGRKRSRDQKLEARIRTERGNFEKRVEEYMHIK